MENRVKNYVVVFSFVFFRFLIAIIIVYIYFCHIEA